MPRGDKSKYTSKEKRQAEHIEKESESRVLSDAEAEWRVWATGGGGYGKRENHEPMRKGGQR